MKKLSSIILIVSVIIVSILFFIPHTERRTFDDVDTDYYKRFKVLTFGKYEQDGNPDNGFEPIEWLVLDEDDDKVLVISKETIISISYNSESRDITWDKSILRVYLNRLFCEDNFTDEERSKFLITNVKNNTTNKFGHSNGVNTYDVFFILNIDEYKKYFNSDKERISRGTNFGKSLGLQIVKTLPAEEDPVENGTFYWARDVGYHRSDAACVNWNGEINEYGFDCRSDGMGARPCVWLKKEALELWKTK